MELIEVLLYFFFKVGLVDVDGVGNYYIEVFV